MGQALRRGARRGRARGNALEGRTPIEDPPSGRAARSLRLALTFAAAFALRPQVSSVAAQSAPIRIEAGRFTALADEANLPLARSLLSHAQRTDTFPGLPLPRRRVVLEIAPTGERFRELIGPSVPEWGSAVAFPESDRVVMQGRSAGARAGDPFEVFRHELAHLALHEALGDLPPRWFDEGYASYAAREWSREDALRTNLALVLRGTPTLEELERSFGGGSARAEAAYALAYRAVAELAALDPDRGLRVFFAEWARAGRLDAAIRGAYGLTLDGFEARWRERTRRRYGGMAMLADVTLAAALVFLIVLPLYVARRRRDRRRLAVLRAADEDAERAMRESILADLLRADTPAGRPPGQGDGTGLTPDGAR
jgi:hypothetical protein